MDAVPLYDPMLSIDEVSEWLCVPKATLYKWSHPGGEGPTPYRVGRYLRYARSDVRAYLDSVRIDRSA